MADIAVLVATSRTCQAIISHALSRNLSVRAIVRSEDRFRSLYTNDAATLKNSSLTVHECDIDSTNDIKSVVANVRAVFIACGGSEVENPAFSNQNVATTVVAAIAQLAPEARPKRIVLLSSHFCHPNFRDHAKGRLVTNHLLQYPYLDLMQTQKILEKNKDLIPYTFMQPGLLVDAPPTRSVVTIPTGPGGRFDDGMVSRDDMGQAMLDLAFDDSFANQTMTVISPVKPKPGFAGMKTQRETMVKFLRIWIVRPGVKALFWVMVGYVVKAKILGERSIKIGGYSL